MSFLPLAAAINYVECFHAVESLPRYYERDFNRFEADAVLSAKVAARDFYDAAFADYAGQGGAR